MMEPAPHCHSEYPPGSMFLISLFLIIIIKKDCKYLHCLALWKLRHLETRVKFRIEFIMLRKVTKNWQSAEKT